MPYDNVRPVRQNCFKGTGQTSRSNRKLKIRYVSPSRTLEKYRECTRSDHRDNDRPTIKMGVQSDEPRRRGEARLFGVSARAFPASPAASGQLAQIHRPRLRISESGTSRRSCPSITYICRSTTNLRHTPLHSVWIFHWIAEFRPHGSPFAVGAGRRSPVGAVCRTNSRCVGPFDRPSFSPCCSVANCISSTSDPLPILFRLAFLLCTFPLAEFHGSCYLSQQVRDRLMQILRRTPYYGGFRDLVILRFRYGP